MMTIKVFLLAALIGLAGCGGGGGGGSSDAAVAPVANGPAPAAVTAPPEPTAQLQQTIRAARSGAPTSLTIVGFGTSVGLAAAVPQPEVNAPVAYLAQRLAALSSALQVTTHNRSVNGSVMTQMVSDPPRPAGYWQTMLADGIRPRLVVFAYGMTDGMTGAYNTGQTFLGFQASLAVSIIAARAEGAEVIVLTTPHPRSTVDWALPAGQIQAYPVRNGLLEPSVADSVVHKDVLGGGVMIPVSVRHEAINQAMRAAAAATGAELVDAEREWFLAVQVHGESALYDPAEKVHPNLLGHQLSYQRAIDAWTTRLSAALAAQ